MESSVYTRGPITQERSKNWGANGIILSLYSFRKKPKLLKWQYSIEINQLSTNCRLFSEIVQCLNCF